MNSETHQSATSYFLISGILLFLFIFGCSTDSSPDYTLHIEIVPEGAGATSPQPGGFLEGENLNLRAIPAENYLFERWEGDLTTISNPADLTMNSDKYITAVFSRAPLTMGGDGSEANPYQVHSLADLVAIGLEENLNKHYIMVEDIDAGASVDLQNGSGFQPIGTRERPFTGSFRGDGYTIYNLMVHNQRSGNNATGFFGYMKNGLIEDVTIDNQSPDWANVMAEKNQLLNHHDFDNEIISYADVSEVRGVGGLIGYNDGGTVRNSVYKGRSGGHIHLGIGGFAGVNTGVIENSHFIGNVSSGSASGFAWINSGQIINSSATGHVVGQGSYGFSSRNFGEIINSFADIVVSGSLALSGFVHTNEGNIRSSFITGELIGTRTSGGFVSQNYGLIEDTYALVDTEVDTEMDNVVIYPGFYVGGFAGKNHASGVIRNSFVAGSLSVDTALPTLEFFGAFAASNSGTIENGYWDMEASGYDSGVGDGNPEGATGLTTIQMTGPSAEQNMAGFDWLNIWRTTEDGYPVLRWEE